MKKRNLLFLCLLLHGTGYSQNDAVANIRLENEAFYRLNTHKDTAEALKLFAQAAQSDLPILVYSYFADLSFQFQREQDGIRYLKQAASHGLSYDRYQFYVGSHPSWDEVYMTTEKLLQLVKKDPSVPEEMERNYGKWLSGINYEYSVELSKMGEADQVMRNAKDRTGDNPCYNEFRKREGIYLDTSNIRKLDRLVARFGMPSWTNVTADAASAAIIIAGHNTDDSIGSYTYTTAMAFLVRVKKEVIAGRVQCGLYAGIMDRYYLNRTGKSYYGEFCPPGTELVNPASVDTWRNEIGLLPLWTSFEVSQRPLPAGYAKPVKQ